MTWFNRITRESKVKEIYLLQYNVISTRANWRYIPVNEFLSQKGETNNLRSKFRGGVGWEGEWGGGGFCLHAPVIWQYWFLSIPCNEYIKESNNRLSFQLVNKHLKIYDIKMWTKEASRVIQVTYWFNFNFLFSRLHIKKDKKILLTSFVNPSDMSVSFSLFGRPYMGLILVTRWSGDGSCCLFATLFL